MRTPADREALYAQMRERNSKGLRHRVEKIEDGNKRLRSALVAALRARRALVIEVRALLSDDEILRLREEEI